MTDPAGKRGVTEETVIERLEAMIAETKRLGACNRKAGRLTQVIACVVRQVALEDAIAEIRLDQRRANGRA